MGEVSVGARVLSLISVMHVVRCPEVYYVLL